MTYQEIFTELKQLRNHLHGDFLIAEKQRIVELYKQVLNKEVKNLNCADCYRDAFIELYAFVQRHKDDEIVPYHFVLKEGEYIHFFGESEYYTNPLPDNVAKRYLSQFPNAVNKFLSLPKDWNVSDEQSKDNDVQATDPDYSKKKRGRPKKN